MQIETANSVQEATKFNPLMVVLVVCFGGLAGLGYGLVKDKLMGGGSGSRDLLYREYASFPGNDDCMRRERSSPEGGQVLSQCKVNGMPAVYGWFEYSHDNSMCGAMGSRERSTVKMYAIWRRIGPGQVSMAWRGPEQRQALINTWTQDWSCAAPPD